ncbi:MAG: hypothetical protein KDE20_11635 [Caldilineaceae bacterium]|nr:hypothetical protein [Caldilineaceae bacterium]
MTTYYVATNGSDAANGTSTSTPWATLQKAADVAGAGDTVLIRGGAYQQIVEITKSGTSGNEIVFDAYPGSGTRETVIIDGKMQLPPGSWVDGSTDRTPYGQKLGFVWTPMIRISGSYIQLKNMQIINGRGVGVWVQRPGSGAYNHHVTLEDLLIENHRRQTLRISLCEYVTCTRVEVALSGTYAPFARPGSYGNWSGALRANDADNVDFVDCICRENWGEGMACAKCDSITFSGCVAYDNWRMNLYLNRTTNTSADSCLLYYSDNTEFGGLDGHNPPNVYIQNEQGKAADYPPLENVTVTNCIAINGGYNLNIGNGQEGVSGSMTGIKIYNNTFVNAEQKAIRIAANQAHTNFYIRNNLFFQPDGNTDTGGGNASDITFDNNLWWDGSGGMPNANLRDAADVYADPFLKRPNAPLAAGQVDPLWYTLNNALSPAIDAGYNVGGDVTDDYFGGTRSTHDIGAHEYGATSPSGTIDADFSADVTTGTGSLTVQFADGSSSTSGIDSWTWRASRDGGAWFTFATAQNPTFTFSPGLYDIQLIVSGDDGDADRTRSGYISVATVDDGGNTEEPGGGGGTGDRYYSLVRVAAAQSAGLQTITLPDSITPNALLMWITRATTDGTAADHAVISVGAWDANGNQWSVSGTAEDNVGTTDVTRRSAVDSVLYLPNPGETTSDATPTVDSVGAGSVTLNWSDGCDGAYLLHILALEVANAYAGTILLASSVAGTAATTDPGFEPTLIIGSHINGTGTSNSANNLRTSIGWAVNGGGQCAAGIEWDDGAGTATGNAAVSSNRMIIKSSGGGVQWGGEVTSFDATGFTVTTRDGTSGNRMFYLALDLGDRSAWAGVIDTPTSTGSQSYTSPAFTAGVVLVAPSMAEAVATGYTDAHAGVYGIVAYDGNATYSNVITNDMGAGTSDTKSYADNSISVIQDDGTAGFDGTLTALSTGFAIDYTATLAAARKWPALVLEAPDTSGRKDWFLTSTTVGLFPGMP